jgi:hypothetical protein
MKTGILRAMALAAPLAGVLAADTLVLNDGTRYSGTFVAGNRSTITFSTDNNGRRTFNRGEIRAIRFGDQANDDGQYNSSDRDRSGGVLNDYDRSTRDRDRGYPRQTESGSAYGGQYRTDMDRAYQTMGSALGSSMSDAQDLGNSRGKVQRYSNGAIYWTRDTGAHAVSGAVLREWERAGAERSRLGYPISDEADATGTDYRRIQQFEHGNIYVDQYGRTRIDYTR